MTEPVPTYHIFDRESHLQAHIVKRLREAGWLVVVTSQDRGGRRQLAHFPDVICFRGNTTLLVECKLPRNGRLSDGQEEFQDCILAHTGKNLIYVVAFYLEDVAEWVE